MFAVWEVVIIIVVSVILSLACVLMGAFIMFRGRKTQGEGFFSEPKGDVFSIPEVEESIATPEGGRMSSETEENRILANTERFLKTLAGEKTDGKQM